MRVVLLRIHNRSVYSNFLNTFTHKNNSTHQLVCVQSSVVNVTSMWAEKDSPLTLDSQARTHAYMREGGGDGSRQVEGEKAGKQTGTMLSWYPVFGIVQCFTVQPMAEMFVQNPPQVLWEAIILVSQLYRHMHIFMSRIRNHSV